MSIWKKLGAWLSQPQTIYPEDKKKRFIVVGAIDAETNQIWDGEDAGIVWHKYILKENGYGARKVTILDGAGYSWEKKFATTHSRYIKVVLPWSHGVDFPGIIKTYDEAYYILVAQEKI